MSCHDRSNSDCYAVHLAQVLMDEVQINRGPSRRPALRQYLRLIIRRTAIFRSLSIRKHESVQTKSSRSYDSIFAKRLSGVYFYRNFGDRLQNVVIYGFVRLYLSIYC